MSTKNVIYNKAITSANTEYSQALPDGTKRLWVQCREGSLMRASFTSGKVAAPVSPYVTIKVEGQYVEGRLGTKSQTLYLASDTASRNAEIISWYD